MVLKACAVSKTAVRGAKTELTASYTAHPWQLGKNSKHLRDYGGEADFISLLHLLIPVPQDLLHETDNLAQTQAGLLPGGDSVSSVNMSPCLGAQALQGCGSLRGLNVSLHSASLCWGPCERQSVRNKL